MLGFFGIKLVNVKTGKLERAKDYAKRLTFLISCIHIPRYKATLLTSPNNHMRIKRILANLNVVGFRQYAIEFVNFLEVEIYGEIGGYKKYNNAFKKINDDDLLNIWRNPLFRLHKYDIFKEWKVFGSVSTLEEQQELYKSCCTNDPTDYQPSILLK